MNASKLFIEKVIHDSGSVMFDEKSVPRRSAYEINQFAITIVLQTPEIFGDLNVLENMMIPIFAARDGSFLMEAASHVMSQRAIN